MTVKELIEKLSAVPQDRIVVLGDIDCNVNVRDGELEEIFAPDNDDSVFLLAELDLHKD